VCYEREREREREKERESLIMYKVVTVSPYLVGHVGVPRLKADREDSVNVVNSLSERALLDLRESADDDA